MAKRGGGGIISGIWSIIVIVIIAAVVVSFIKINNINSINDAVDFFRSKSSETQECASGEGWKCNPLAPDSPDGDSGSGDNGDNKDEAKPATASLKTLESIPTVEAKDVEYSRGEWKHWLGSPCNTREEIIKSSGKGVETDSECRATSGEWTDPYTGDKFTDPSKMDADHVIALNYAASHGGNTWSEEKKTKFANDKSQILLVGASPNRAKGDKGPSEWMPENESFKCDYAKKWVSTADKYASDGFGIAKADKEALKTTLESCG